VAQAQAALTGARRRLAYANLTAPFAGIVVARLHNDGESVDANTPIVDIASDQGAVFTAQFTPRDAARIKLGERATITAQGGAEATPGRVVAVNPDQGDARTIPVLIRISTSAVAFGPGAYGKASIRVGTRSGLIVPKVAIVTDAATGSVQVFRRDGDRFAPVPVTVLDVVGDSAIISAPTLRSGTVVAGQGAFELLAPPAAPKADND
jgi:multidrug efflux pump subunit AcrA (membrane-fusion protein)